MISEWLITALIGGVLASLVAVGLAELQLPTSLIYASAIVVGIFVGKVLS